MEYCTWRGDQEFLQRWWTLLWGNENLLENCKNQQEEEYFKGVYNKNYTKLWKGEIIRKSFGKLVLEIELFERKAFKKWFILSKYFLLFESKLGIFIDFWQVGLIWQILARESLEV